MKKSPGRYRDACEQALVDISWAQWNRLGLYGGGKTSNASTDIEVAIALVSHVGWLDGRLFDGALSWIHEYQDIVSGERLKFFIKDIDDPFFPRCVGAAIESAAASVDAARWRYFLKRLRESLPKRTNEKGSIFWYSRARESWTKRDPQFKKWGLAKEETVFSAKLKSRDAILGTNAQIRFRYLFGNTARADVTYILAAAGARGLMTADLAAMTGYNHSSVFRVLKDLARSGIVESHGAAGSKRSRWYIRDVDSAFIEGPAEALLVNWKGALPALLKLLRAMHAAAVKNELIAKHACFTTLEDSLRTLRSCGFTRLPHLPTEPLEKLSLPDILDLSVQCMRMVEDEITA